MHGFGPSILHALPTQGPGASTRDIMETLRRNGARCPSLKTVQGHLLELRRLDLVYGERNRYWRLVDTVYDQAIDAV